jgi:hypothetical protein
VNLHLIASPGRKTTLGPAEWYRVHGALLLEGPRNTIIARYAAGCWHTSEAQYSAIVCEGPAICHFEHGTTRRDDVEGPFGTLTLVGLVLWGDHLSLARMDLDTHLWRLLHTEQDFQSIVWRAATRARAEEQALRRS